MTIAATSGVGWTLARLSALTPLKTPARDVTSQQSREQILGFLQESDGALSVEALCTATGLHANTVRGHLEVLVASGDVARTQADSRRRGRPPWLYHATKHQHAAAEALRSTLAAQLAEVPEGDEVFIVEAAQRWAESVAPTPSPRKATSPEEAVALAATALSEVGFDAEVSPLGDTITLHACPYASLVADHPVICDIHTALLGDLLEQTGQDVRVTEMQVWATPTACLARLARPDLAPRRVIAPAKAESADTTDQRRSTPKRPKRKKNRS